MNPPAQFDDAHDILITIFSIGDDTFHTGVIFEPSLWIKIAFTVMLSFF